MIKYNHKVTFITVFYNRSHLVDESVASMLSQTYDNIEYILWDDASVDGTFEELIKFKRENVHVRRSEGNQGLTRCLIEAVSGSAGDYVAIHGSGDISSPDRITRQVSMAQSEGADVVGCMTEAVSEALNHTTQGKCVVNTFSNPLKSPVTHGEVLYSRRMYDLCGGYRSFFTMSQDYDLWLRMRDAGASFKRVPANLYRTFSLRQGISGNYKSRYIQGHYAMMSYQCWLERQKGRIDVVELYGLNAWAFFCPNSYFSIRLNQAVRLALQAEEYDFALMAVLKSLRCHLTLKGLSALAIILFDRSLLKKPVLKTLIFGENK